MKIPFSFFLLLISVCGHAQSDVKPVIDNIDKLDLSKRPLIVLDGTKKGVDFDLKEIDPKNISKIEVVKGDSAKLHYGEAGINGVIVITSKSRIKPTAPNTIVPTISNKPLFIVEGIKKDESFMTSINPNDIESISVLKDANATDAYGDAGKNGVIIISLKKGSERNLIKKIK